MSDREVFLTKKLTETERERATLAAMCDSLAFRLYRHDNTHKPSEWVQVAREDVGAATKAAHDDAMHDSLPPS